MKGGEVKLWCAVVMQIIKDCRAIKKAVLKLNSKKITFRQFMEVRLQGNLIYPVFIEFFIDGYLSEDNSDFKTICEYVNMDSVKLLRYINKIFDGCNISDAIEQAQSFKKNIN